MDVRNAFTFGEILASLVLLGLFAGAILNYIEFRSHGRKQLVLIADENTRATLAQEGTLLGGPFRTDSLWNHRTDEREPGFSSVLFPPLYGVGGGTWRQTSPGDIHPRHDEYGVYLVPETDSPEVGKVRLSPPIIHYSGEILASWFPLMDLLGEAADNPLGTYYRYQWADLDPDEQSWVWDFGKEWAALDIQPVLRVQAFHPDPYYLSSEVIRVVFKATAPELWFRRSDGSESMELEHEEIMERSNLVILGHDAELPELWEIRYTLDGRSPLNSGVVYDQPFLPVSESGNEILLRAIAVSRNGVYPPGPELQVLLTLRPPMLTVQKTIVADYPVAIDHVGECHLDPDPGEYPMSPGEEVELVATPAYGYSVEWEGVDRSDGNRAWVTMNRSRQVHARFHLGLVVAIFDEQEQLRQVERFRYRAHGEEWSEWLDAPVVLAELEDASRWEFEIEDLLHEGHYRSLYPIRNYLYDRSQDLSLVKLYSREPQVRSFFQQGTQSWTVPQGAPERLFVELVGGGAAGAPGWISQGGYWDGGYGNYVTFEVRMESGGGGGSGFIQRGVIPVPQDRQLQIEVGAGGIPENQYELRYTGSGYQYRDGSSYTDWNGNVVVRETSLPTYPRVGKGRSSRVTGDDVVLEAEGGHVARNPHSGSGNIVSYPVGGVGGFGGGGGHILWGGRITGGPFPEESTIHPAGGPSLSQDFVFYPFSVLEFADGGMAGAAMTWMSSALNQQGGNGGSGTGYVYDPFQQNRLSAQSSGGKGYRYPLDWFILNIPTSTWLNGVFRQSPAEVFRGLDSLEKQKITAYFLDFLPAGGGGGGVRVNDSLVAGLMESPEVNSPAEGGWYAATWANVYDPSGYSGQHRTAGSPGSGFGAGGGGASAPWSHPDTWGETGGLGHYTDGRPASDEVNRFIHFPSRGNYADDAQGTTPPSSPQPNARGMMGPPGGQGANGIIVIYY